MSFKILEKKLAEYLSSIKDQLPDDQSILSLYVVDKNARQEASRPRSYQEGRLRRRDIINTSTDKFEKDIECAICLYVPLNPMVILLVTNDRLLLAIIHTA
jgi:hypothetical protein